MSRLSLKLMLSTSLLAPVLCGGLASAAFAKDEAAALKGLVQKFYDEAINQNKLELADRFFAPKAIEHEPVSNPSLPMSESFKASFRMMRIGFPDLSFQVEDMLVEGDKVVVRFRMLGTHQGMFARLAPTGKRIDIPGIDILRISRGQCIEHWGYMDSALLRQQLGQD